MRQKYLVELANEKLTVEATDFTVEPDGVRFTGLNGSIPISVAYFPAGRILSIRIEETK